MLEPYSSPIPERHFSREYERTRSSTACFQHPKRYFGTPAVFGAFGIGEETESSETQSDLILGKAARPRGDVVGGSVRSSLSRDGFRSELDVLLSQAKASQGLEM